jgi:hypothetical protein
MRALLMSEMRRALHRRVVWVLIGLALIGCGLLGVIAFFDSAGKTVAELRAAGGHPALMINWTQPAGDNLLLVAAFPLALGAVFGGASFAGAEWKAGTITTVLTWEPRRGRVLAARMTAAFVLAAVIAFALTTLFLAAALPAVLTHGSTAGVDGEWWIALGATVARLALLSAVAAVLAVALAMIGRGTTFALAAVFAWMAVVEPLLRGWKPSIGRHLIGENLSIALTWAQLESEDFTRAPAVASLVTVAYCSLIVLASAVLFLRRDVTGAS